MRMEFKSRISVILSLIIWPLILIPFGFFIKQVFLLHHTDCIPPLIIFSLIISFIGLISFGIRYIIENDKIIFKTGFFKNGEIEISRITKINRSYMILASNANSMKRLKCDLTEGSKYPYLLISPMNEDLFLKMIKDVNPNVKIDILNKKTLLNWDFNK